MVLTLAANTNVSYGTILYAFSVLLGEDAAGEFDRAFLSGGRRGKDHIPGLERRHLNAFASKSAAEAGHEQSALHRVPLTVVRPPCAVSPLPPQNGLAAQGLAAVRPLTEKPEDHPESCPEDELGA